MMLEKDKEVKCPNHVGKQAHESPECPARRQEEKATLWSLFVCLLQVTEDFLERDFQLEEQSGLKWPCTLIIPTRHSQKRNIYFHFYIVHSYITHAIDTITITNAVE